MLGIFECFFSVQNIWLLLRPRTWSSSKICFLTVCVSLSGLGPSETHEKLSMRKMRDSSNEKQGEKLFLLWRHSALLVRPFSCLAKNRRQGKPYGARHHNWPLFVIAAVLSSDFARRQLRYRCKAGNESYPTPKTACACDVRLLNYAWNNVDWLTGDLWSWLSANQQRLRCNGPNGHSGVA